MSPAEIQAAHLATFGHSVYELHDSVSCRFTALRKPTLAEIAEIQSELRRSESKARLTLYRNGVPLAVFRDGRQR